MVWHLVIPSMDLFSFRENDVTHANTTSRLRM
jgi:hypothetical protein